MKRIVSIVMSVVFMLVMLASCSKSLDKMSASELLNLGEKYLLELNYEKAIVSFKKMIEVDPMNPRGYTGLAEAYIGLGDTSSAIDILKQGLSVFNDDNTQKIEFLKILIQIDKANPDWYIKLAEIHRSNKDIELAIDVLNRGIAVSEMSETNKSKLREYLNELLLISKIDDAILNFDLNYGQTVKKYNEPIGATWLGSTDGAGLIFTNEMGFYYKETKSGDYWGGGEGIEKLIPKDTSKPYAISILFKNLIPTQLKELNGSDIAAWLNVTSGKIETGADTWYSFDYKGYQISIPCDKNGIIRNPPQIFIIDISRLTASDLSDNTTDDDKTNETLTNKDVLSDIEGLKFVFSSGAGAWATEIEMKSNGSFVGHYYDGDYGDRGDDYPNGTLYECHFNGKFVATKKLDEFTYSLKLHELNIDGKIDEEKIIDGGRIINVGTVYGLDNTDEFLLYVPGKNTADLPEEFLGWVHLLNNTPAKLPFYGLYNVREQQGFSSYSPSSSSTEKQPETSNSTSSSISNSGRKNGSSIFICENLLIGGFDESKWIDSGDFISKITQNEIYRLFSTEKYLGDSSGSIDSIHQMDVEYWNYIKMNKSIEYDFAVSCDWDPCPRFPRENDAEYESIVSNILTEQGLSDPVVNIVQNYRIDLEGDGFDEVVLYAEYSPDNDGRFSKKKGSYSLLLLRKIINGNVENIILDKDAYISDDFQDDFARVRYVFGILGFADLNGDNKLEIITIGGYYEGKGYKVYEIQNNKPIVVLKNGVGF